MVQGSFCFSALALPPTSLGCDTHPASCPLPCPTAGLRPRIHCLIELPFRIPERAFPGSPGPRPSPKAGLPVLAIFRQGAEDFQLLPLLLLRTYQGSQATSGNAPEYVSQDTVPWPIWEPIPAQTCTHTHTHTLHSQPLANTANLPFLQPLTLHHSQWAVGLQAAPALPAWHVRLLLTVPITKGSVLVPYSRAAGSPVQECTNMQYI